MKRKNVLIIAVLFTIILLFITGITYAYFSYSGIGATNSQLVVGDIYMHFNETSAGISLNNMMPISVYSLNTNVSEESINACVSYLYNTYGEEWNDLVYQDNSSQQKNNYDNIVGSFMGSPQTEIPQTYENTYANYCAGYEILVEDTATQMANEDEYVAEFLMTHTPTYKSIYILNDVLNNVLSKTDILSLVDNSILIDNIKNLDYFEFTIDGKNTNPDGIIYYNIELVPGDDITSRVRIADNLLMFRLTEVTNGVETILVDKKSYSTLSNAILYGNIIPKQTNAEISKTYRLYMWLNEDIKIGNTSDAIYTIDEWNNLFASVKVNVNGEYIKGEILTEKLINKVGSEGLVAVDTNGNLDSGSGTIREYRYSGIGNYCTYTDGTNDYNLSVEGTTCPATACSMTDESGTSIANGNSDGFVLWGGCTELGGTELSLKTNEVHDSGLRNYIMFNGEMWRIVGIFNGEIKIVKDTPLLNDIYSQTTYTSTETSLEYNLKYETPSTKYGYFIFKELTDSSYNNDWTTSGVKAYLNEENGYYGTIKEGYKNLISNTTYYLGNVTTGENSDGYWTIQGSASEVYNQERSNNIWEGNQVSWTGKVGLLYPSDYGYASNSNNWSSDMSLYYSNGGSLNNWLSNTEAAFSWFLSPSSDDSLYVLYWINDGYVSDYYANSYGSLRPVLNLKSTAIVISGDGSYNNPYVLLES